MYKNKNSQINTNVNTMGCKFKICGIIRVIKFKTQWKSLQYYNMSILLTKEDENYILWALSKWAWKVEK